jgi:hypothetical protein
MTEGSVVTDCWGGLFYITPGLGLELGFDGPQGFPLSFHTELSVAMFLGSLSSFDLSLLSQRFNPQAKRDRTAIQRAIMRGRLHVFPMDASIALVSAVQNNARPNQSASAQSNFGASNTKQLSTYGSASNDLECVNRTVLVVRSDIRNVLQQIVQQERIESRQIEKSYKTKSALEKTGAHIQHFRKGLHDATGAFLTWLKDINDVVSINQRMLRILMAAQAASHVETENRYELFQKLLNQAEKKELVEALGFDPSLITVEKITEVYSLAKLIHDDQATQLIIVHFVENYIKAQHSLEWSEFSGGASFEIILTALLVVVTGGIGGIGVIASLGAQARKLSQMKKLGALLSELAELLKKVPKAKGRTLREQKALADKKERKKEQKKKSASSESKDPDDGSMSDKSVAPDKATTPLIPENYDFLRDKSVDAADESQLLNDSKKKTQLIDGQEIIIDDPSRITFTNPEPNGSYIMWNLYDKQTEAVITRYVKATPETGPDMWLRPYNAEVEGVGEVKLKAEGFSWTKETLKLNLEAYKKAFQKPAPNLNGQLAESNMSNFQSEFVQVRSENPSFTPEQVANEAVANISFGKHRIEAGYGKFDVTIEDVDTVNINGVNERNVPVWVEIEATPTNTNGVDI